MAKTCIGTFNLSETEFQNDDDCFQRQTRVLLVDFMKRVTTVIADVYCETFYEIKKYYPKSTAPEIVIQNP